MLVLTRKIGESIIIGDGIEVMVTDIRGDKVRIGIEAPQGLPIRREELLPDININRRRERGDNQGEAAAD